MRACLFCRTRSFEGRCLCASCTGLCTGLCCGSAGNGTGGDTGDLGWWGSVLLLWEEDNVNVYIGDPVDRFGAGEIQLLIFVFGFSLPLFASRLFILVPKFRKLYF